MSRPVSIEGAQRSSLISKSSPIGTRRWPSENETGRTAVGSTATADRLWVAVGLASATYAVIIEGAPSVLLFIVFIAVLGHVVCRLVWPAPHQGEQRSAYVQVLSAGILAIAISRTTAIFFDDPLQNAGDAQSFFDAAAFILRETDIFEVRALTDGWGAVWLWKQFYSLAAVAVSEPTPVLGLTVNGFVIAFGGALLVDAAAAIGRVVDTDPRVTKRTYVWCFILWLFASFHLRDAFTVVLTVAAVRAWIWLYERRSAWRTTVTVALSLGLMWLLGTIRTESASIVIVTMVVGVAGLFLRAGGPLGIAISLLVLMGLLMAYRAVYVGLLGAADLLTFIREGYQFDVSSESLGDRFILSQGAPLRAAIGFAYLQVFPIPMWSGFTTISPYHWFKSLQSAYMAFLVPMAIAGATSLWRQRSGNRAYVVMLGGLYTIISFAVALSSLETRHVAQVTPALMLLASVKHSRYTRNRLFLLFVGSLAIVHALWAVLKFI